MVNGRALLALVLQLSFLAAGFGWRTAVHRRRTGDSGLRRQRHDRVARVSGALFGWARNPIFAGMVVAAVGLALLAPTLLTAVSVVMLVVAVQVQVRRVEEPNLCDAMPGWPIHAQRVVGRFLPRLGKISR